MSAMAPSHTTMAVPDVADPGAHRRCDQVAPEPPPQATQDQAIGSEESDEHAEDTVTAELRPGYRMHDRVLRPALVRVSRRPA